MSEKKPFYVKHIIKGRNNSIQEAKAWLAERGYQEFISRKNTPVEDKTYLFIVERDANGQLSWYFGFYYDEIATLFKLTWGGN